MAKLAIICFTLSGFAGLMAGGRIWPTISFGLILVSVILDIVWVDPPKP